MSSKPKQTTGTSTTTQSLSPEASALLQPTIPIAQQYLANPPQLPDFSTVAGFDPNQVAGQEAVLSALPEMQQVATDAAGANRFMTSGDVLNPETNPGLQGTIDAASRQITQTLGEQILPNVRGEAVTSGQYGSSRQGIAEGIASRGATDAVGDATSRLLSQNYLAGLSAMNQATALSPQVLANLAAPGVAQSAVGDVRQGLAQSQLDEAAYRDFYQQASPFLAAQEVAAMASGLPGGTAESTSTTQQPNNTLMQGLGLGAALLGGFLSDRRFKRNVERIGELKGHPLYEFEYTFMPGRWQGVMADEVPHAAYKEYGIQFVDYGRL